ncbi:hypothetical protein DRW07_11615 [Alteromonas sediminis]|uniref:HNH domain-containing protein n=1 Tax=Alteromonas sediminis TaxID=2259342 RepID=A0A3N5Y240_9ALTE|nr:HNH endonuclease [Alteromonas sediminis]RPJ66716.1 hypothetical protein DRW07_11615 [Alteromonas sediminis]
MPTKRVDTCPCCRRTARLTFHHLIPKKMHRRPYFRKHFSKQTLQQGVMICRQCHDGIHKLYNEMQLAKHFTSLDALKEDELLARHFRWVGKQQINVKQ